MLSLQKQIWVISTFFGGYDNFDQLYFVHFDNKKWITKLLASIKNIYFLFSNVSIFDTFIIIYVFSDNDYINFQQIFKIIY